MIHSMDVLDTLRPLLLVAHGLLAVALTGAAVHAAVAGWTGLRGAARWQGRLPVYANVLLWSWIATLVTGLLIYPPFRVAVRAECFDLRIPLATGFFEVKEHWLAMGLPVAAVYRTLARRGGAAVAGRGVHLLGILLGLVIVSATGIGFAMLALDATAC